MIFGTALRLEWGQLRQIENGDQWVKLPPPIPMICAYIYTPIKWNIFFGVPLIWCWAKSDKVFSLISLISSLSAFLKSDSVFKYSYCETLEFLSRFHFLLIVLVFSCNDRFAVERINLSPFRYSSSFVCTIISEYNWWEKEMNSR